MRRLGPQRDADGYLACHDVGVNASKPSGRTKADRSRSASRLPRRSPVTRRPDHIPECTIAYRRGALTADIAYNIASSSSM